MYPYYYFLFVIHTVGLCHKPTCVNNLPLHRDADGHLVTFTLWLQQIVRFQNLEIDISYVQLQLFIYFYCPDMNSSYF